VSEYLSRKVRTKRGKKMKMRAFVVASTTTVALVGGLLPVAAAPSRTDSSTETLIKRPLIRSESEINDSSQGTNKRSRPRRQVEKNEWDGYLSCSARNPGTPSFSMANCAPWDVAGVLGPHESSHVTEAKPGLKTIVVAMVWEPGTYARQPYLQHDIFVNIPNEEVTGQNYTFREEAAESGLEYRLDVDPSKPSLDWDSATGPIPIEFRISAGSAGEMNLVLQQPFTVYYHLFYGKRAPKKHSALP
jgi:hypothetical protein